MLIQKLVPKGYILIYIFKIIQKSICILHENRRLDCKGSHIFCEKSETGVILFVFRSPTIKRILIQGWRMDVPVGEGHP